MRHLLLCSLVAGELCALHDDCELQVELIQTASLLESREVLRGDEFEDAIRVEPASKPAPSSLLKALILSSEKQDAGHEALLGAVNATAVESFGPDPLAVVGAASSFSLLLMLFTLCLFGCLRERYPAVYLKKVSEPGSHGELPPDISETFAWLAVCWRLPVDEIANHSNLDHGMLIQFCDAAVMCLLSTGLPALLLLAPLCAFSGGGTASSLSVLSFANVAAGSWTCYVYPFFVWYTVVVSQAFMFRAQRAFVERRYQWLRTMTEPRATTVLLSNIAEDLMKESALKGYLEQKVFGKGNVLKSMHFVKDTSKLEQLIVERSRFNEEMMKLVQGEVHERRKAVAKAEMSKVEAQVDKLQKIIEESDEYNLNSAFVTFHDRHDAVIVLKVFASDGNEEIVAELAPDTDDVIWNDLRPSSSQWAWDFSGLLLLAAIFLIFVPLVVANATFSTVAFWEKADKNVASFMDQHWALRIISEALAGPLVLTFLIAVLGSLIASVLINFFVLKARGMLQHLLQRWYYVYLVLFVVTITTVGKILPDVLDAIRTHKALPPLMAQTFLGSSLFYMDFVILSCAVHGLGLLRLMPLYRFRLHSCVYEEQTAIAKSEPEDQDYNGMGARSARLSLCYLLVLLLGTVAPLITIMGAVLFAICRIVYTYLFVYAEILKPDLGGLFWYQQLKHAQMGTFLYIILMTVLLLERASNRVPGIICGSSALFQAFSYYTFVHRFRWEQLEFSEIPDKIKEGAPDIPRVYGHYKQPELPPPKPKESALQRAATTMRMRVGTACCDVGPQRREADARGGARHKTMPATVK